MNHKIFLCNLICVGIVLLSGCTPSGQSAPIFDPTNPPDASNPAQASVTYRDNSPKISVPVASGVKTTGNDLVTIDYSNNSEGYVIVSYLGTNPKVKIQITGPEGSTYTYCVINKDEIYPLNQGSGEYTLTLYENIQDTEYLTAFSDVITCNVTSEFGPYLYPNQMVMFDATYASVAKASELAATAENEIQVVENVFKYIIENLEYDHKFAATVKGDYIPNADATLASNKGICCDYATLMAVMLRSQGIPTRVEVGYVDEEYHEWLSVHTEEDGWIDGIIHFDGEKWIMMDPTISDSMGIKKNYQYITSGEHYTLKLIY